MHKQIQNSQEANEKKLISAIEHANVDVSSKKDFESLIHFYSSTDNESRIRIRQIVLDARANLKLLSFSELLATLSFNECDSEYAKYALMLHSIENFSWDPRENIIYLSVIWYVMQKLKLNHKMIFEEVISLSSKHAKENLEEFLYRPDQMKTLKSMGLCAVVNKRVIKFEVQTPAW